MTIAERLVDRLRDTRALEPFGITLLQGTTARRTYAGPWQRRAGVWVWSLRDPDGSELFSMPDGHMVSIGSVWHMRDVLAAEEWTVERPYGSDINVDPA